MPSEWLPERVDAFWRFVVARHALFIRRVLERQPPPWTDDPVLAGGHYTNVYRELDRVTRDYLHQVVAPSVTRASPREDRLWNTILYRVFNLPATYQALGGFRPAVCWDKKWALKVLLKRQDAGHKVFTGAYMIQAYQVPDGTARYLGRGGKTRIWVDRLAWTHARRVQLLESLDAAADAAQAHAVLAQIPGVGGFTAYELLTDLLYAPALLPFTENDWTHAGPGAIKGLLALRPLPEAGASKTLPQREAARLIAELRDTQQAGQAHAGVALRGPALTLRAVEHTLCEFSKMVRLQHGIRPKRTYKASAVSADLSPWDDIPGGVYGPAPIIDGRKEYTAHDPER